MFGVAFAKGKTGLCNHITLLHVTRFKGKDATPPVFFALAPFFLERFFSEVEITEVRFLHDPTPAEFTALLGICFTLSQPVLCFEYMTAELYKRLVPVNYCLRRLQQLLLMFFSYFFLLFKHQIVVRYAFRRIR